MRSVMYFLFQSPSLILGRLLSFCPGSLKPGTFHVVLFTDVLGVPLHAFTYLLVMTSYYITDHVIFSGFSMCYSQFQVACPMNVKREIKPTNQNCLRH